MKQDAFDKYVAEAKPNSSLSLLGPTLVSYPYMDVLTKSSAMSSAYLCRVTDKAADGAESEHTVIVAYHVKDGEPDFSIWCGDKFVDGRIDQTDAKTRCAEAVGASVGAKKVKLVAQMMECFSKYKDSDKCSFWTTWRRDKQLCVHTSAVLAHLRDTTPDFKANLEQNYESMTTGAVPDGTTGDLMLFEELAFRVPVLFEGERGAGKTVTARAFARTNAYRKVEFGGHEGIESPDMLGFLVPVDKSSMVWKDGPIAEAFRAAKTQKVVLLIDELLRIRQRELSLLLTALSPDEGVYRLRTGRIVSIIDGIATEEELECPVENLCVVATTNVGSEYAVDEIDPALAERFVILRKDTTIPELTRILREIAKNRHLPLKIADNCVSFYSKMVEARSRGLVKNTPTTRTLARALNLATDASEVRRAVKTQMLLWVARNSEGQPVPEQIADVEKLIDRCFK